MKNLIFFHVPAMTAAQKRIADTIHHFYDETAPLGLCGSKYREVVEKLDEDCRGEFVSNPSLLFFFFFFTPHYLSVTSKR